MKIGKIASSAILKGWTIPKLLNFGFINWKKTRTLLIWTIPRIYNLKNSKNFISENSKHFANFTISKNNKFLNLENYQNSVNFQFYKY